MRDALRMVAIIPARRERSKPVRPIHADRRLLAVTSPPSETAGVSSHTTSTGADRAIGPAAGLGRISARPRP
jgi:hypothetical protein